MLLKTTFLCCFFAALRHGGCLQETDFRLITAKDLYESVERFTQPDAVLFTELLFDVPRYQLIVGARNYLFRLSLEGLRKLEEAHWPADVATITTCRQKGQTAEDCQNFIKVLLSYNNKIFTCGTNAFSPECTFREINSLNIVTKWVRGAGQCPYNPHSNTTALITVQGDYYIASPLDFSSQDHAIYRITDKGSNLRTVQYNPKWLSGPDFVASYEIGNFTYFFFRETAVEYINCGKIVYSRVGRVCKNDQGGKYMLKDNWTTFLKARLNCSIPGQYPFYYNELQGVDYHEKEQMIFATFTTASNSIYGSAVCAFKMSAIVHAFDGPFKYQKNPKSSWEKQPNNHQNFQCETMHSNQNELDAERYQLMDESVQSLYQHPIYHTELERLSHVAVDIVPTKQNTDGVPVIFVTTNEGLVRKFVLLPNLEKTCLVEEIHLFATGSNRKIHSMKLLKDLSSLYLGTDDEVIRLLVHRCQRFKTKESCLSAMDPYCGWNEHQLACTTAPHRNPRSSFWKQNLTDCPNLNVSMDGSWSMWSSWYECAQTGANTPGDQCLCRSRQCNSPTPANGGKDCIGAMHQVTNCSQHGQWTEWSSWSGCSGTCGLAVKTRRRTCGNPAPAFGGRVCIGPERDEIFCTSNPPCPANNQQSVNGKWTEWSPWDECSAHCGGGIQMRRRKCSPPPSNGGQDCIGCNLESRLCNSHKCPEVRKTTPWTPWLRANATKDGYYEQRFRFTCRVNVPESSMVRVGQVKKEERYCSENHQNCLDAAFVNIDGEWSEWNAWSKCSVACGGGVQYRERICDNPRPSGNGVECQGIARQEQECNDFLCQGYWSCWSEYSACSVTCGQGTRVRTRRCLVGDGVYAGTGCEGPTTEHFACEMSPCHSLDGWEEWSVWSLCDSNKEQHRKRSCIYSTPTATHCQGASRETRICIPEQLDGPAMPGSSESRSSGDSTANISYIVAALFCGFVGGGSFVGLIWYFKSKCKDKFSRLTALRPTSKGGNLYAASNDWQNNYNLNNDLASKIPLREATIKRNGFRAQLDSDHC